MNALQPDADHVTLPATQHQNWDQTIPWVDELQRGGDCNGREWAKGTASRLCAGQHGNHA
jgi:hypothetical protein